MAAPRPPRPPGCWWRAVRSTPNPARSCKDRRPCEIVRRTDRAAPGRRRPTGTTRRRRPTPGNSSFVPRLPRLDTLAEPFAGQVIQLRQGKEQAALARFQDLLLNELERFVGVALETLRLLEAMQH